MGLKKIGSLWKPKPGGKSVSSGWIEFLGQQIRVVITYSKFAGQKQGNCDYNIMADDGKDDRQGQQGGGQPATGGGFGDGGGSNYQPNNQPPPEGFSGSSPPAPASGPPSGFQDGRALDGRGPAPEPWE